MRVTKQEFLDEAKYLKGEYNKLNMAYKPTRMRLKELAIEEGILLDIEERTVLKRALRSKRKAFKEDLPTYDLVRLAVSNKIKLENLWK